MTMQPRPTNPIEKKKQDVRRYSRNGVVSVAVGVGGGALMALLFATPATWLMIGLVIAVVGGGYNFMKVRQIVNENNSGNY